VALERVVPTGPGLAWGTFLVNVVGTFVLASAAVIVLERLGPTRFVWPMLATGVCGSFTTFSTFVVEVDLRLRSGDVAPGLGYGAASIAVGLVAVVAGTVLARGLLRRNAVRGHGTDTSRRRRQWS
jgi:CrcB protein